MLVFLLPYCNLYFISLRYNLASQFCFSISKIYGEGLSGLFISDLISASNHEQRFHLTHVFMRISCVSDLGIVQKFQGKRVESLFKSYNKNVVGAIMAPIMNKG